MNYSQLNNDVLKQGEWIDELRRWENSHPKFQPFVEDSDSQRALSKEGYGFVQELT